jgi:hypothetical protein
VRAICGDTEDIPLPGETVKRGSVLGNYLSDVWKDMG